MVVGVGSINSSVTAKEEEMRLVHRYCSRAEDKEYQDIVEGLYSSYTMKHPHSATGFEEAQSEHGGPFNTAGHMDAFHIQSCAS